MTIQEALKSGKPFRRRTWGRRWPKDWYIHPDHKANILKNFYAFSSIFPALGNYKTDIRDILAEDWEVKK